MTQQTESPSRRIAREITALLILIEEFASPFLPNNDSYFFIMRLL